jgi:hypothetical protein
MLPIYDISVDAAMSPCASLHIHIYPDVKLDVGIEIIFYNLILILFWAAHLPPKTQSVLYYDIVCLYSLESHSQYIVQGELKLVQRHGSRWGLRFH